MAKRGAFTLKDNIEFYRRLKMAVSKCSLVGLFVFLCLGLGSANRILKDQDAENEWRGHDLPSGQDLHAEFGHAGLKGLPINTAVSSNGCCNYGNCGQSGYVCPQCPSNGCGDNSGCQSCYTSPPCQWQGCQGLVPSCGCVSCIQNSEVQHEFTLIADPPTVRAIPQSNQANQKMKPSGGLV